MDLFAVFVCNDGPCCGSCVCSQDDAVLKFDADYRGSCGRVFRLFEAGGAGQCKVPISLRRAECSDSVPLVVVKLEPCLGIAECSHRGRPSTRGKQDRGRHPERLRAIAWTRP